MGYIWVIRAYSHLISIRGTQTRVLFGALGRHQAGSSSQPRILLISWWLTGGTISGISFTPVWLLFDLSSISSPE